MLWIALVSLLVGESLAQLITDGSCPNLQPITNFNPNRFSGRWYEQKTLTPFQSGCVTSALTLWLDGSVSVIRQEFTTEGTRSRQDGSFKFPHGASTAKFSIDYSIDKYANLTYWVLGIDYDEWVVIYACDDVSTNSFESAWILTRAQYPSDEILEKAYALASEKNISSDLFYDMDNESCPARL